MPVALDKPTTRVMFRLYTEDYIFLQRLLADTGETPNSFMRRMVELYVKNTRKQILARAGAEETPDKDD